MKKERNCTNFEIRMPMFGSPALPTHKVAERVEVVLRIPSFSLLASWGKFFGILLGPATTFSKRRFSAVKLAASLRGGLREVSG